MTLVVGVKYKDGIIMGSDSQATLNRGVPLKKLNQAKLFELRHCKNKIVIGGAGAIPFISKAIEEIQNAVKNDNNISFLNIISVAEKSVLHVARWYNFDRMTEMMPSMPKIEGQSKLIAKNLDEEKKGKEFIEHEPSQQQFKPTPIVPVDIILIIAGIDEDSESQIYIIYSDGVCEKQQSEAAIGSGAAYAEYLLSRLSFENMTEHEALKIITQVIYEVRKIDPGVGGMPQLIKLTAKEISKYSNENVSKLVDEIEKVQLHVQDIWAKYIKGDFKPN
jgi:20S proteasome alpha/beta subunit